MNGENMSVEDAAREIVHELAKHISENQYWAREKVVTVIQQQRQAAIEEYQSITPEEWKAGIEIQKKEIERLRALLANQWKPIGEAPKERPFLAYQQIVEDPADMDNYWIAEWFEGELDCGAPSPTHCWALPAPPENAKQTAKTWKLVAEDHAKDIVSQGQEIKRLKKALEVVDYFGPWCPVCHQGEPSHKESCRLGQSEARLALVVEALEPVTRYTYRGFTKAGNSPATDYYDIRFTRDELAKLHTAYYDNQEQAAKYRERAIAEGALVAYENSLNALQNGTPESAEHLIQCAIAGLKGLPMPETPLPETVERMAQPL